MGVRELQRMFEENHQKIEKEVKENFSKGIPLLHQAIENNDVSAIQKLLQQRVNVNCKNPQGIPAINFAMKQKNVEIVKLLAKHGADLNNEDTDNKTVLSEAVLQWNFDMIAYLLDRGATFDRVDEIKLKRGANVFTWDAEESGENEFHCAVARKLPVWIYDYFDRNRVSHRNKEGESPFLKGVREKTDFQILQKLISFGADVTGIDNNGNSAFHLAIMHHNMEVIHYFIENKIQDEFLFPNKQNETPISLCIKASLPVDVIQNVHQKKEGECSICLHECEDLYYLANCKHSFCRECIGSSYLNSFDHYTESFPCPQIACKHSISLQDLQKLMSSGQFDRYNGILLEKCLKRDGDFHWCPECEDGGFYNEFQYDHEARRFASDGICSVVQCNSCPAKFCSICSEKIGEGEEAEEIHKETCKGYASLLYIKSHSKICPNCKIFVQHSSGCSHMTCTFCKYQFCYICLGPYKGRQVFDMNSACTC
jgi:ankyrin repeat protein